MDKLEQLLKMWASEIAAIDRDMDRMQARKAAIKSCIEDVQKLNELNRQQDPAPVPPISGITGTPNMGETLPPELAVW